MSSESQGLDPYAAVLADLKAKRDQIDAAIQAIEGLRATGGVTVSASATVTQPGQNSPPDGPGAYLGMTIPDAAKKVLATRRQTMGNADILAALKAGGLHLNSRDPINTIGSVLTRRFNVVGDIVRVGRGTWGLKEWYPNRSFKEKQGRADADSNEADGNQE